MKSITLKELHAKTGAHIRRAARSPIHVTDRGAPIAVIGPAGGTSKDIFARIRALRARLRPGKDESLRELINAGRRL
jgi:antitoxin (DNA-binding transcriptional repressor) of toxin-antitoxin stability system